MKKPVLIALIVVLLAGGGFAGWWFTAGASGIPTARVSKGPVEPRPDHFTIVWAGDTMLGWNADKMLRKKGYDHVLGKIAPLLEADYTVINLEAPATNLTREDMPEKHRKWTYQVAPKTVKAFADLGIDAWSLANNHLYDRGRKGVFDTFAWAGRASKRRSKFGSIRPGSLW